MSVENYANITNHPFILNGNSKCREAETLLQDAGRTADLERHTVMSYDPTNEGWVPFTDETATDGTQFPRGIVLAKVETAAIVAGDVSNIPILVGNAVVDQNQLVIENSLTLATIVNVPAGINMSVQDSLERYNIVMGDTVAVEEFENAPA